MKKEVGRKKRKLFFMVLIFLVFLINFVAAVDVAYIYRNKNKIEQNIINVFSELGLGVELVNDNKIPKTDFSSYGFIFIGNERFRNIGKIPLNYSIIIMNSYYGKEFGLIKNGISQLAANFPLKIKKQNQIIKVYNKARFKLGGTGLKYYYLPSRYKRENIESIATTNIGYKNELGDVVAYSTQGAKKCFFGIIESDYWTEEAREMFKECVDYVYEEKEDREDETGKIHDVKIDDNYPNSVDGIRIRDADTEEYLLNETSQLICNKKYKIDYKTVNAGNFSENISFFGKMGNFNWSSSKENLEPEKTTTAGSKTINITFESGFYDLEISAILVDAEDAHPEDNFRSREVEVVC